MARLSNFGEHPSPRCSHRHGASARTAHALALASDGLVSDFVRRDFLRKARSRTAEPEELYRWYVESEDDDNGEDTPSHRIMPPSPERALGKFAAGGDRGLLETFDQLSGAA
eukprot:CAMPEP_0115344520 /NCGR_PEP_ID=MMETSP0270-20121206/93322_1 /TAXON_ID=71861 /ORGANISM="Scrippsiella trochoidea, Strain CCMP3099" /LENGTH=111 /DNA_ID=CAMNT_0002766243 /DNA_START=54 /DNA_END=387 /DNA_ORIENTATION=+